MFWDFGFWSKIWKLGKRPNFPASQTIWKLLQFSDFPVHILAFLDLGLTKVKCLQKVFLFFSLIQKINIGSIFQFFSLPQKSGNCSHFLILQFTFWHFLIWNWQTKNRPIIQFSIPGRNRHHQCHVTMCQVTWSTTSK